MMSGPHDHTDTQGTTPSAPEHRTVGYGVANRQVGRHATRGQQPPCGQGPGGLRNIGDGHDLDDELSERIVLLEWRQFQHTDNEGGRASCQDDWPTFHTMRLSQFLTWPVEVRRSYLHDLQEAEHAGRNLITEKYARMMQSTAPDEYRESIAPHLPSMPADRRARQEVIIAIQVAWARDFHMRYPCLGTGMRRLTTTEDTSHITSFETYLRGELSTYSERTLDLYESMIDDLASRGANLTEQTVSYTVRLAGFANLQEAEDAQPR